MDIAPATPEEWYAAFDLALSPLPEEVRRTRVLNALALVAAGEIDPHGIFVARSSNGLCGVQVCVPLQGASALFWLPKTQPFAPALEDDLVRAALTWVQTRGAKVAQAIIPPEQMPGAAALVRCGFTHITGLDYLEHALEEVVGNFTERLQIRTYSAETEEIFHTTLMWTYEGTLDFPELNNRRTLADILAGHKAQGPFVPQRWWLAYRNTQPVGVVMIADVPDLEAWDLSYLGIIPEARGQGYAQELTTLVLKTAQAAHVERLIVAVDQRNLPAVLLYQRRGFRYLQSRAVFLDFFDKPTAGEEAAERR